MGTAGEIAVITNFTVGIADNEVDLTVPVEVRGGQRGARSLEHVKVPGMARLRSDFDGVAVLHHKLDAFVVELGGASSRAQISMEIHPALMHAVENVGLAVAVKIHDIGKGPLVSSRRLVEDFLAAAENALRGTEKLRVPFVLIELRREALDHIEMSIPIPVEHLCSPAVEGRGLPLARQPRSVLPQGRGLRANVVINRKISDLRHNEIEQAVSIEVNETRRGNRAHSKCAFDGKLLLGESGFRLAADVLEVIEEVFAGGRIASLLGHRHVATDDV